MKKRAVITALVVVLLVCVLLALGQLPLRPWCTLASLRRVDDFPLYVMHYYGDYGFDSFLKRGLRSSQALAPWTESTQGWTCSGFAAMNPHGDQIFGRNFDWHNRQTLLLFTDPPHGYASVSMVDISYLGFPADSPSWADRQKLLGAPFLPFDGMNEHGLAVGMMAVPYAQDEDDSHKVTIGSLHAIRLMLDYAADLDRAIALLEVYTIDFGDGPPIHYLIADASGRSAVIEYVAGNMTVLRNEQPWQVSTNFVLAQEKPDGASSSCWRYNRAYERLAQGQGLLSQVEAMSLLKDVSQSNTIWSIVYNLTSGEISVAVGRKYDQVHIFGLKVEHI